MTDVKLGEVRANNRHRSMSRKTRRLYLVLVSLVLVSGAVALVLAALRQDIVFFLSPTELAAKLPAPSRMIRIGGLVERGSLRKLGSDGAILFEVTDLSKSVKVRYRGILPDLFREGQGVVIEGTVNGQGEFIANEVLAKHDEKYLPPEVARALKASGRWQESGDQTGSTSLGGNPTGNDQESAAQ